MKLMPHVGIVGLGLMGQAFAQRLLATGYAVWGHDVQPKRQLPTGLQRLDDLSDLVDQVDLILLAVFDTAQVESVLCGPQGLLSVSDARPTVLCCSTCDPDGLTEVALRSQEHGLPFIELPFSGTSLQVARGEGVGLMGGDAALIAQWAPVLDVICPKREHVGGFGDANRTKLAVNLVLGLHRAALAEGLMFGRRMGLDPARLLHTLQNSAAASSVMGVKGGLMVERRYEPPQSRVDQSLKDFKMIAELGAQRGQPLPLAHVYIDLLQSCAERGESHLDNAIIQEAIARLSPLETSSC
jgi:3-hydroxyisobutyrate dehydrogenase-like beta-hydroxyacid dehydrogenase